MFVVKRDIIYVRKTFLSNCFQMTAMLLLYIQSEKQITFNINKPFQKGESSLTSQHTNMICHDSKEFCHKKIIFIFSMLFISKSCAENSSTVYRNSLSIKRYLHSKSRFPVLRFLLDSHFVYLNAVFTFVFYCV